MAQLVCLVYWGHFDPSSLACLYISIHLCCLASTDSLRLTLLDWFIEASSSWSACYDWFALIGLEGWIELTSSSYLIDLFEVLCWTTLNELRAISYLSCVGCLTCLVLLVCLDKSISSSCPFELIRCIIWKIDNKYIFAK